MIRIKTMCWVVLMMLICIITGCADDQKYGKGDPPDEYVSMFGNDNGARLDFMQNQDIAKLAQAMNKIAIALVELDERVKVLETPKQDHSKCILDQNGRCMTTKGCKVLNPDG